MPSRTQSQEKEGDNFPSTEQPLTHELEDQDKMLANDLLINSQKNDLVVDDVICLNQNQHSEGYQNKCKQNLLEKDVQENNVKAATQTDDETLLNIIDSADLDQINTFLNKNHTFSQNGLNKALILACHHGLKYLVQKLVCLGADVEFKDAHGNTPLMMCAKNGFIDIVRFVLEKKADVNAYNSSGDTALILSIRLLGSLEMIKVLLEQEEIDIHHQNCKGHTALMKALKVRNIDMIKMLMDKCFKCKGNNASSHSKEPSSLKPKQTINSIEMTEQNFAEKCGFRNIYSIFKTPWESPLVLAFQTCDVASLNVLLHSHFIEKDDICEAFTNIFRLFDLKGRENFSNNKINMISRLLDFGADIKACCKSGPNPLDIAVKAGNFKLVQLFCRNLFMELQTENFHYGTTAFSTAVKLNRYDIVALFLAYGIDINGLHYNDSPLDCALIQGHFVYAKLFIMFGAKIDIKCALHSAVINQVPEYLSFILDNYQHSVKRLNIVNSLFVCAVHKSNLKIIQQLHDAGADVNSENIYGDIPLTASRNEYITRLLISWGANVNKVMRDTETPLVKILERYTHSCLDKACNYGSSDMEITKILLKNGASINQRLKRRGWKTPVIMATYNDGWVPMLQILLDHGADVNVQDIAGNTAVMYAMREYFVENETFLYKMCRKTDELSAVAHAVISNKLSRLLKLSRNNIDNVKIKYTEEDSKLLSALVKMCLYPEEKLMALIRAGGDVNCQNKRGISPLMVAAERSWYAAILILINSGADVNAVSKGDCTKTAISFLSADGNYGVRLSSCLKALLSEGASSSYAEPSLLQQMIFHGEVHVIPQLIQSGFGPADVDAQILSKNGNDFSLYSPISPLCAALLNGDVLLAQYFVDKLFLTYSDITSLKKNNHIGHYLNGKRYNDCVVFFNLLFSRPMTLFQLAFVAVSSAIGSSPGRENRVNMLSLPEVMKDKLFFKSKPHNIQLLISYLDRCLLHKRDSPVLFRNQQQFI